jgi:hypothetical protein
MPAYPSIKTAEADMTSTPGEQRYEALIASPFKVEIGGVWNERIVDRMDQ